MIWTQTYTLDQVKKLGEVNMMKHLDISIDDITDNTLSGSMPVDHRTHQPHGLLHGGASVVLAETLASLAANLCVDQSKHYCVGLEINANHLGAAKDGRVDGVAIPVHLGRTTQVWEIKITQGARNICISRMTASVLERKA